MIDEALDENDKLKNFAYDVYHNLVTLAEIPSRTSTVNMIDEDEDMEIPHCVFCGKELPGRFDGGTFVTYCDCEGAQKENTMLLRLRDIDTKIAELKKERDALYEKMKLFAWKSSSDKILKARNQATDKIAKAFELFNKEN